LRRLCVPQTIGVNLIMEDLRRTCFFCAERIEEKKTLEHIIPNSLLGKLSIKEKTITGQKETQYSRVKVPPCVRIVVTP
jgi:hypothetical protein